MLTSRATRRWRPAAATDPLTPILVVATRAQRIGCRFSMKINFPQRSHRNGGAAISCSSCKPLASRRFGHIETARREKRTWARMIHQMNMAWFTEYWPYQ
ncbi:hypothetical protein MAUB_04900 [Mycolicibacterium aubagnense]|uniref:Uncharacterized protein n=1 Tax=Mycolicibacterium aubagnense TaxID=319707 RepID=A0ABN5YLP1_9MYCO|nr:hypothetical protein MAUB_04900 [Mycolicibacterium aubagnense]